MILVTHGIVGGALAAAGGLSPLAALVAGFVSHFVLDAIPHWDYHLRSSDKAHNNHLHHDIRLGRDFMFDLLKIGLDIFLGFVIPLGFAVFYNYHFAELLVIACGVLGAILPDFLQFAYFKIRREPLISLQRFHVFIHSNKKIKDWKVGIGFQLIVALVVVAFLFV